MSTVVARTFACTPARDAHACWMAIVDLLTQGRTDDNRKTLEAVAGVAASVLADQGPRDAPIVVTCDGPRTRVYCLYDDDAIEGSDVNEATLGFNPLKGDWALSLPCPADDLTWVQAALAARSSRITARDAAGGIATDPAKSEAAAGGSLVLDVKGFLGS